MLLLAGTSTAVMAQFSKPRRAYVEYVVTADRSDRTYPTGREACLTVEAYKGGIPLDGVKVIYSAGDEMMAPSREDTAVFREGRAVLPLGTRREPGFLACKLRFTVYDKTYKDLVKVAFAPDSIRPYTVMPRDFDRFWAKTLRTAARTDLAPEDAPAKIFHRQR